MSKSRIVKVANMSFKAIRENKNLAKIYEFTVHNIYTQTFDMRPSTKMGQTVWHHQTK